MENIISAQLKQRVMRNIYGIWLMRQAAPIVFIELPVIALLGYLATKFIFVERVLTNIASSANGILDTLRFVLVAFLHTHLETQIVLGLSCVVGFLFVKDFTKSIRGLSMMMR